jgi:hypothetical protein
LVGVGQVTIISPLIRSSTHMMSFFSQGKVVISSASFALGSLPIS